MVDEAKIAEIKGASKRFHEVPSLQKSPTAKMREREELMRESWVKSMELRLVRDEVDKCHKAEGVNHYESCRWLAEKYLHMLRENRVCFYISSPIFSFWLNLHL